MQKLFELSAVAFF